jgi:hypothetical protein
MDSSSSREHANRVDRLEEIFKGARRLKKEPTSYPSRFMTDLFAIPMEKPRIPAVVSTHLPLQKLHVPSQKTNVEEVAPETSPGVI